MILLVSGSIVGLASLGSRSVEYGHPDEEALVEAYPEELPVSAGTVTVVHEQNSPSYPSESGTMFQEEEEQYRSFERAAGVEPVRDGDGDLLQKAKGVVAVRTKPAQPKPAVADAPKEKQPAVEQAKAVNKVKMVIKRRTRLSDEDLQKLLVQVPEMSLRSISPISRSILAAAPKDKKIPPESVPEYAGLPLRMGVDCQLGKESAENLQALSRKMRGAMAAAVPEDGIDPRPAADKLKTLLLEGKFGPKGHWLRPEAVPTLKQMLMVEDKPLRLLLVDLLEEIDAPKSTAELAGRAIFDVSIEVRAAAVQALSNRPSEDYRSILLAGLRYPLASVADHASEALVALRLREVVPELARMLSDPDPSTPYQSYRGPMIREVARINHLANCLMCHAQAMNQTDPVRGRIPTPGQQLPPPLQYYESEGGIFVRADVTYLQQDFSVPQPVANHGQWPAHQRYDYIVHTRPATQAELHRSAVRYGHLGETASDIETTLTRGRSLNLGVRRPIDVEYPQRQAVLFALRELTHEDAGDSARDWQRLLDKVR